jgi:hypothetical protein
MGIKAETEKGEDPISPYSEGDNVFVTWRNAVYKATVIEVIDRGHVRVHYEGHQDAWDEIITPDRIVKGR